MFLTTSERSAGQLDDELDRDELRQRYYGLLQELRVLLPGVQVLVAFLLTAPFAQRFADLDASGRTIFGISLVSGLIAVVAFVTPTAFHRLGARTSRSERLVWAIRMTRVGIGFMALSLVSALLVVCRLIYGTSTAFVIAVAVALFMILAWMVLPSSVGREVRSVGWEKAMTPADSQMPADTPLLRVLADFEASGYVSQFVSRSGGALWCVDGDHRFSPGSAGVEEQRRIEGASDPSDMMMVLALRCPICDAAGTLVLRYGPESGPEDADVLAALPVTKPNGTSSNDVAW